MPEKKSPSIVAVTTHTIMNLLQYSLMGWAAFETTGLLHWGLVGYLAFCAVVLVGAMSANAMKKAGA